MWKKKVVNLGQISGEITKQLEQGKLKELLTVVGDWSNEGFASKK